MLTLHQLEKRISHLPADKQDVIIEVHNIVAGISPNADMNFYDYGVAYYNASQGGTIKGGICILSWDPKHEFTIRFGLGRFLPDPQHLLSGDQLAMRYYNLPSFENVPWEPLIELIKASSDFVPTLENTKISDLIREKPHQPQ